MKLSDLLPDLDKLLSEPEPEIVIYDDTYATERSVRKQIAQDLKQITMSSWDLGGSHKEEMVIAFQSLAFLTARDVSRQTTELDGAIHIRKEDIQNAIRELTSWLTTRPVETVQTFDKWRSRLTQFLKAELQSDTKKEAVFRTCEKFKIDVVDFRKLFPTLPK